MPILNKRAGRPVSGGLCAKVEQDQSVPSDALFYAWDQQTNKYLFTVALRCHKI